MRGQYKRLDTHNPGVGDYLLRCARYDCSTTEILTVPYARLLPQLLRRRGWRQRGGLWVCSSCLTSVAADRLSVAAADGTGMTPAAAEPGR